MVMDFQPKLTLIVFLAFFMLIYISVLVSKAIKNSIDLYDFILLSTLALIPFSFVVFPCFYDRLAVLIGIAFPFLLLFGSLLLVVFIYLYRLVIKANSEERSITKLVQEIALLKQKVISQDAKLADGDQVQKS